MPPVFSWKVIKLKASECPQEPSKIKVLRRGCFYVLCNPLLIFIKYFVQIISCTEFNQNRAKFRE